MFKKRRVYLAAVLTGIMLTTSGCSAVNQTEENKEIYKKITVGSDKFEPYIYQDDKGNFIGVDVDIATEALYRMGYEPEFKQIVWENKNEYLKEGTIDCLWGCFSMNGREDEYQWAGPYLYSSQVVVVRSESNIKAVSDLEGKKVAVQETGKAEEYLLHPKNQEVPIVYAFSSMDEVYSALRKNYVDAICGHERALDSFVETAPDEYRMLNESLFSSKLGVAFSKDYDAQFVEELNDVLSEMLTDGTTETIIENYDLDVNKSLKEGNSE